MEAAPAAGKSAHVGSVPIATYAKIWFRARMFALHRTVLRELAVARCAADHGRGRRDHGVPAFIPAVAVFGMVPPPLLLRHTLSALAAEARVLPASEAVRTPNERKPEP